MNQSITTPLSRNDIRRLAELIRNLIPNLSIHEPFPIVEFFEWLLPQYEPEFQLKIVPLNEMEECHGRAFPEKNIIEIREDVYIGACAGSGRDRATMAHELGHYLMHSSVNVAYARVAPGEEIPAFKDPEWQAKAFAGELLVPAKAIGNMSVYEIASKYQVSEDAARVQKNAVTKSDSTGNPLRK